MPGEGWFRPVQFVNWFVYNTNGGACSIFPSIRAKVRMLSKHENGIGLTPGSGQNGNDYGVEGGMIFMALSGWLIDHLGYTPVLIGYAVLPLLALGCILFLIGPLRPDAKFLTERPIITCGHFAIGPRKESS